MWFHGLIHNLFEYGYQNYLQNRASILKHYFITITVKFFINTVLIFMLFNQTMFDRPYSHTAFPILTVEFPWQAILSPEVYLKNFAYFLKHVYCPLTLSLKSTYLKFIKNLYSLLLNRFLNIYVTIIQSVFIFEQVSTGSQAVSITNIHYRKVF